MTDNPPSDDPPVLGAFFGPILLLNRSVQRLVPRPATPWLDVSSTALKDLPAPAHFPGDESKNLLGIPFAPEPSAKTLYWPVRTKLARTVNFWDDTGKQVGKNKDRGFGKHRGGKRPDRLHVGVDLFGNHHDVVVAIEAGRVISYRHFYEGVWHCLVDHTNYVINYGEIEGVRFCNRTKDVKKEFVDEKTKEKKEKVVRSKCPGGGCNATCTKQKGQHANPFVVHETYTDKYSNRKERYVVRRPKGKQAPETLQTIADSFFGVSVEKLREANPKVKETPKAGTKITIPPALSPGDLVSAGQPLGEIGRMKKSSMLHFEMYDKAIRHTHSWWHGKFGMETAAKKHKQDHTEDKRGYLKWVDRVAGKAWAKSPNRVGGEGSVGRPNEIYLDPTKYLIYLAENAK